MFAPWRSHNSLREPRKNEGDWQPANRSLQKAEKLLTLQGQQQIDETFPLRSIAA